MNSWSLGAIEQAELDAGLVRDPAHQAIEGIDLAHQMTLAKAADCRIAGHLADGVEAVRDKGRARTHARSSRRGLAARMPAANNNDIKVVLHGLGITPNGAGPRVGRPAVFHGKQSRRLLPDTKPAENMPQHVFDIDPSSDAAQRMGGLAHVLRAQFHGLGVAC